MDSDSSSDSAPSKNESATLESVTRKAKTKKSFVDVKVTTAEILSTKKREDMIVNRKKTD